MTIHRKSIEIIASELCNLRCAGCSHGSVVAHRPPRDRTKLEEDVRILAQAYSADSLRVLGGEPLLRNDLEPVLKMLRKIGIAKRVVLVTNGILLHRVPGSVLRLADEVNLSLFPTSVERLDVADLLHRATKEGWQLTITRFDRFRVPFSQKPSLDVALTQRVYNTCQLAHVWHCHTVQEGRFYKCPQATYLGEVHGLPVDDLSLDLRTCENLSERIEEFLDNRHPLSACAFCAGAAGIIQPHQLTPRNEWVQGLPLENLDAIDLNFLEKLEFQPDVWNGCPSVFLL